ncbi:MAG: protoporphyrinogen oxidase [Gemmatimonadales bacterium]|nr:MAG: protoporphyrinogen oxidase [Gemmatimonadales bacterium]
MTSTPPEPTGPPTAAVVGAGLAGLAAAFRLHRRGVDVRVFEAAARPGGMVRSHRAGGFLAEAGPHSLSRPDAEVQALFSEAGLGDRRIMPDADRSARFIVREGKLIALPSGPAGILSTPLLSLRARMRILAEPLRPRTRSPGDDESVADLLRRRGMGQEIVDRFLDPFVAGVYAGNPERLSAEHAFPLLLELEREHGSLIRGLLVRSWTGRSERRKEPESEPPIFSFRDGMEEIPRALARPLSARIHLETPVTALTPDESSGWRLHGAHGDLGRFDRILLALPAHRLATLDLPLEAGAILTPISRVPHPPIILLTLGFPRSTGQHPMDGFGMLIPRIEKADILGALFPSTLFSARAPEGHVSVAAFVGGTRQPELASLPDEALEPLVLGELGRLLGIRETPVFRHLARWERSIPQVNVGYAEVKAAAGELERALAGVHLAGSWRNGVSVGDALGSGLAAAERIIGAIHESAGTRSV